MANALPMAVQNPPQQVSCNLSGPGLRHTLGMLVEKLEQIAATLFRDNVELAGRLNGRKQLDDKGALEHSQNVNFVGHAP